MHRPRPPLFCAAALSLAAATGAQAIDGLDTSWNGIGTALMPVAGYNVTGGISVVVQPDGRMLLAGGCATAETAAINTTCMARLQPNAQRDYSFGPGETGVFPFPDVLTQPSVYFARALTRLADGRIVVGGYGPGVAPNEHTIYATVTRLLANGTLDPAVSSQPVRFEFAHDTANPQSLIAASALQTDGRLIVVGTANRASTDPANADMGIARLRSDLSLDPTFNGGGTRMAAFDLGGTNTDIAYAVTIQADGKILAAGASTISETGTKATVLRLNADGTPDNAFGNTGRASFDFRGQQMLTLLTAIQVDRSGRIWVAGYTQFSGTDTDFIVARLHPDGTLDTAFCNGSGYKTVPFDLDSATTVKRGDQAWGMLLQSDGRIVLTGFASNGEANGYGDDFAAARLMPDCSLDPSFGSGGKLHAHFASAMPVSKVMDAHFGGSGIVLAGFAANVDIANDYYVGGGQFGVAMIRLDLIFSDGFDAS